MQNKLIMIKNISKKKTIKNKNLKLNKILILLII